LKIIYREKSSQADPVADDLATVALDLLVEAAGYDRMSPNSLLIPGHSGGT
jgi:FdhE protein